MKRKLLPEVIEYKKLSSSTKNSPSSGTLIYHVDVKQCPHCNYLCENDTAVKIHTKKVKKTVVKLLHELLTAVKLLHEKGQKNA
jgi:hypothetical protein